MIVPRHLMGFAHEMLQKYPIITITGPRQSGKTTFAQVLCPDYVYVSLENIDNRSFAQNDPKGFLETYQNGAIIDEIQYVPALFSYLQTYTDQRKRKGEYILTGSQQFLLLEKITQSLAGRVAVFSLLPFSFQELKGTPFQPKDWLQFLYQGAYPRQIVDDIQPKFFYANYLQTYLERDVRQLTNVHSLLLFQRFMQLLAGRAGQLLNQNNLAIETGIDNKTVSAWLSVLEASYIVYRLPPYYQNFNKRIIKAPKLYFYDTGLAAYLLGINSGDDANLHFAKGALFANLVINELLKKHYNRGERPQLYFWNDSQHHEIDLLFDENGQRQAFEIKSGKTIQPEFFRGLHHFKKIAPDTQFNLVYGGDVSQLRTDCRVRTFYE